MKLRFKHQQVVVAGLMAAAAYADCINGYQNGTAVCKSSGTVVDKVNFPDAAGTTITASTDWDYPLANTSSLITGGATYPTTTLASGGSGSWCGGPAKFTYFGVSKTMSWWEYATVDRIDFIPLQGTVISGASCT